MIQKKKRKECVHQKYQICTSVIFRFRFGVLISITIQFLLARSIFICHIGCQITYFTAFSAFGLSLVDRPKLTYEG